MCFLFLVDWDIELIHLSCSQCLIFLKHLFIYLRVPGLSCSMWDLVAWPQVKLSPLHWEHAASGPPEKSPHWFIIINHKPSLVHSCLESCHKIPSSSHTSLQEGGSSLFFWTWRHRLRDAGVGQTWVWLLIRNSFSSSIPHLVNYHTQKCETILSSPPCAGV